MSRILPDPLVGHFAPEVLEVYRALKGIPDEGLTVWASLPVPDADSRPHFLVVVEGHSAFLLTISGAGQTEAEEAAGLSLFSRRGVPPGRAESSLLRQFLDIVQSSGLAESVEETVCGLVLFPRVRQATIDALRTASGETRMQFLGSEILAPGRLGGYFRENGSREGDPDALAALRAAFTPESVVPSHFSAARKRVRNTEARLAPMLLDFEQEQWAKQKLVLSSEAASVAEEAPAYGGASLVTGVAGSGKSLVLLFRACTQARLAPGSRALVLTHNKALKSELEARFGDLGRPKNVLWHTFFSWTVSLMGGRGTGLAILQYEERDRKIGEVARRVWGALSESQVGFLRDEFDWMQDRALDEEELYLNAERQGRILPLGEKTRRMVFATYLQYRTALEFEGREDWSGLALRLWHMVEARQVAMPVFDFIYIDEAQFFAPVWFSVIRRALRPSTGRILLAADPTQGFLKRRQSWVACGLDLRGRSTKLRRSYRSTRRIMEFAAAFYRVRFADEELPDLNLAGEDELEGAEEGELPVPLLVGSRQDEIARALNETSAYLEGGGEAGHLLVLVAGTLRVLQVLEAFAGEFGEARVRDARQTGGADQIRICGIDAATGLEAPIVFLLGCAGLLEEENEIGLKDEARRELERDNTRRLYMAFTRAGRRLAFTWVGEHLPAWADAGTAENSLPANPPKSSPAAEPAV